MKCRDSSSIRVIVMDYYLNIHSVTDYSINNLLTYQTATDCQSD